VSEDSDRLNEAEKRYHKIKVQMDLSRDAFSREAIIRDILYLLQKEAFSFKEAFQASTELLDKLKNDERLKWQFKSDELMPFGEWFMMKVLKQDRDKAMQMIDFKK
jgi:hypothetical protein